MKRRLFSLILCVVLITTFFAGCNRNTAKVGLTTKFTPRAQLVVAANPVFVYEDDNVVAPINDIKKAIDNDISSATITSLSETDWSWITRDGENWKKRPLYGVEKWKSGTGAKAKDLRVYSFSQDGTISVASYNTKNVSVETYSEELSQYGILLSVGAKTQEAFCYTVPTDGTITIPEGTFTAIQKVGSVKTGFLAEDGTGRSAVVSIQVNSKVLYHGQLCNSVAGDGTAVTQLTYPTLENINVTAGDTVTINLILNARVNKDEDVSSPEDTEDDAQDTEDDYSDWTDTDSQDNSSSDNSSSDKDNSSKDEEKIPKKIPLITGYDATFKILRSSDLSGTSLQNVVLTRINMEKILGAEVILYDDETTEANSDYEIIIGESNRPESEKVYKELKSYRAGHAADYIIRMVGKKLVIAATTDYSLENAINYFMENYCKDDRASVPSDLNVVHRPDMYTIMLGDNNIASFAIRTERFPSVITVNAAKDIQNWIIEKTGYTVSRTTDQTKSDLEILVYSTARSGYKNYNFRTLATENMAESIGIDDCNNYKITFDSKKLYINAGSTTAANFAVQELLKEFEKTAKNGKVQISKGYKKTGAYKDGEYTLSNGYGLTWNDEFTGDYDDGTRLDRNKWELYHEVNLGTKYEISKVFKKFGISNLDEFKNKFKGNWITGDYSFSIKGNVISGTVPEGYIMNGINNTTCMEGKDGNFYIDNNALKMMGRPIEGPSDPMYDGVSSYMNSEICTNNTMLFRYGIYESRTIMEMDKCLNGHDWLNAQQGSGNISAGDYAPEIDLAENFGMDNTSVRNMHTWVHGNAAGHVSHNSNGDMGGVTWDKLPDGEKFSDTYHHWGVEWTPDYLAFLIDGEPTQIVEINNTTFAAFHEYVQVLKTCLMGNDLYNINNMIPLYVYDDIDEINSLTAETYTDFVRIYQKDDDVYGLKTR